MNSRQIFRFAIAGALVSLYAATLSSITLVQGVFAQKFTTLQFTSLSALPANNSNAELIQAALRTQQSSVAALGKLSAVGQSLATREFGASVLALGIFCVIMFIAHQQIAPSNAP